MTTDMRHPSTAPRLLLNHNFYQQSVVGSRVLQQPRLVEPNQPPANRISSALITDHDINNYLKTKPTFRPVTSHNTSVIASLYKQQANIEDRQKLPLLYQQKKPIVTTVSQNAASRRRRGPRSFTYPSYSSVLPFSAVAPKFKSPSGVVTRVRSSVGAASETWNKAHESIAANGQGLLQLQGAVEVAARNPQLQHRSTVNYVPFYETRERGDGASVVDVPSMDVEGKKIETEPRDATSGKSKEARDANSGKTSGDDRNSEGSVDAIVSSLSRRNPTRSSSKVEKKVRFSSAVTENKVNEPSYTEDLIRSLHREMKMKRSKPTSLSSGSSRIVDAIEERSIDEFTTPVMKVVVTKRQAPTGSEKGVTLSPREAEDPRRVASMASRIIKHYPNGNSPDSEQYPGEVLRRGTQATQRASTAGESRKQETIARVAKSVPKRQTVVMPNFPKQPVWQRRSFPLHSVTSKSRTSVTTANGFNASVQGNNFNGVTSRRNENLRSRLSSDVTSGTSQPKISDVTNTRPSTTPGQIRNSAPPKETESNPVLRGESALPSPRATVKSAPLFNEFQPIPSMPDHINFCDPRKTELILRWLDDVNKKRNIESKLKRTAFSRAKA